MPAADPPPTACWRHQGLRSGFEVAFFKPESRGWRIEGTTAGLQDGDTWVVSYAIRLDASGCTRTAQITARTTVGMNERVLEADGRGHWMVDGNDATHLEGCMDVDLESSAMTNSLPVRRLRLEVGQRGDAPGAYVGVGGGGISRLDQCYARVDDDRGRQRYDYEAPAFDFRCRLVYDEHGLVLDYPGIAVRVG